MAINYNLDNRMKYFGDLLAEYQTWFLSVIQGALLGKEVSSPPTSLPEWINNLSIDEFNIDGHYGVQAENILQHHAKLVEHFQRLIQPSVPEAFFAFSEDFKSFITELQKFGHTATLEEWGLDVLTGLKNITIVKPDLAIEKQRLSREGHPFSIGLARIDDFAEIQKKIGHKASDKIIKTTAGLIQKSLRSYDDAYRISRDHFVICLKQSDTNGGQRGLERLRDVMTEAKETFVMDNQEKAITLSCVVATPLADDDLDGLMDNLYIDLDKKIRDQGSVLAFQEMSPLQRFVHKESD